MRTKLKELHEIVLVEVEKARLASEDTHKSAVEITASARHSPSQSGDREHATNQAAITVERYTNLLSLAGELENALRLQVPRTVTVPCFVRLKSEFKELEAYIVSSVAYVPEVTVMSSTSSLGTALEGKNKTDSISLNGNIAWKINDIG